MGWRVVLTWNRNLTALGKDCEDGEHMLDRQRSHNQFIWRGKEIMDGMDEVRRNIVVAMRLHSEDHAMAGERMLWVD